MSAGLATNADQLMATMLPVAVALRIAELQDMPPGIRARVARSWAERATDPLASQADMLLRRTTAGDRHTAECDRRDSERRTGRRRDCDCLTGSAQLFNHAARGLAAMALGPGGVDWLGVHWCAVHPGGIRCADPSELDCAHVSGHGHALPVETVRAGVLVAQTGTSGGGQDG